MALEGARRLGSPSVSWPSRSSRRPERRESGARRSSRRAPAAITIDYGRPSLKGRDMFSQLQDGAFWRLGRNEATVLTTPVDLAFGGTRVAKGAYSLWLKKSGDVFLLVFNAQTGQWGTQHDPAKDVASVTMVERAAAGARRDVHHRASRPLRRAGPSSSAGEPRSCPRPSSSPSSRGMRLHATLRPPGAPLALAPAGVRRRRFPRSGASRRATSTGASHPAPTSTSSRTAPGAPRTRSRPRWCAGAAGGRPERPPRTS